MNKSNIALLSTVINIELYNKSSQLFPKDIDVYLIDGTNGMFGIDSISYMMKKLKGKDIEWLIMADEDVLFIEPNGIYSIIDKMRKENYFVSGVRDGGVISNRTYSPYLINTFFSIINFKELEVIWNEREVRKNQYINEGEFEENLSGLKENFDVKSVYEPYYCFYFWLRRKGKKILFLVAEMPFSDDNKTTLVFDAHNNKLLYHTWYARSYGNNEMHTNRINRVFDLLHFENKIIVKPIIFKDKTFLIKSKFKKLKKRIKMKIQLLVKPK